MNGNPIRQPRSDKYLRLPLRLRLAGVNNPARKNIRDIRLASCQAQKRSKPNQRFSSSMRKARHRYGGAPKVNPAARWDAAEVSAERKAPTMSITNASR